MYPELSVRRDAVAEREELAARMVASGFAFRVEPLDVEGLSREAGEELKRQPVARQKRESRSSLNDDEGLDMRTAGLPVVTTPEDYLLHLEKPIYPQDALELGIEGRIVLKALVGLDGIVKRVVVVESHVIPSMEQAAVDAVLKCRFRPYRQDGEPAAFWARFPIVFRITNG
jgi:TonB family protein